MRQGRLDRCQQTLTRRSSIASRLLNQPNFRAPGVLSGETGPRSKPRTTCLRQDYETKAPLVGVQFRGIVGLAGRRRFLASDEQNHLSPVLCSLDYPPHLALSPCAHRRIEEGHAHNRISQCASEGTVSGVFWLVQRCAWSRLIRPPTA